MDNLRQKAFQKLRPPCVELSSTALKFKAKQVAVKDVLHALDNSYAVVSDLGREGQLDEKLSEYAFFPLTHVFNESQRLSPRCLEIAVQSVTILVSYGWRQKVSSAMGKQLLILMSLLSGGDPRKQGSPPTDELKVAAFECIAALVVALSSSSAGASVFDDQGTKNVVDQLFYLLLGSITESASDIVQIAAAKSLSALNTGISNRVFLASLLPRTVSSLTKALKPSTLARRTHKVLVTDLRVLQEALHKVLADSVALNPTIAVESEVLNASWIKATAGQVKNALMQVVKLRAQDRPEVAEALRDLCLMVIDDCSQTLQDSIPTMLETLVILTSRDDNESAKAMLKHLLLSRPAITDILRTSFSNWTQSFPRLMQSTDDKPKELMLSRISSSFDILSQTGEANDNLIDILADALVAGIGNALQSSSPKTIELSTFDPSNFLSLVGQNQQLSQDFQPIMLDHQSQRESMKKFTNLIDELKVHSTFGQITRTVVDQVADAPGNQKLAPLWLAVQLLTKRKTDSFDISDIFNDSTLEVTDTSRSHLLNDLFTATFTLLEDGPFSPQEQKHDWRLIALSIECVVLNAERYSDKSYRPELMDTLYPVLTYLSSSNTMLQSHAMTAINRLASACQYTSATEMLIENVDYLVNSVAWKLNTFNISPEAPQILQMMVRLCGVRLIPYLDDLIQSIFGALDNYHGYPEWVEILFQALKTMVDESVKSPALAITEGKALQSHEKQAIPVSTRKDILDDLRARRARKKAFDNILDNSRTDTPHQPWKTDLAGTPATLSTELIEDSNGTNAEELSDPTESDTEKVLSKPHQLLLSIANSTAPHLASPSPRVRHLLLDLLSQISPLLSRDDDSFLPLVNSVWPVIVPRLFAEQPESGNKEDGETVYNICAAADAVAVLCQSAGDFMSTRIDEIFQQLTSLFKRTARDVESRRSRLANNLITDSGASSGSAILSTVDLQVVKAAIGSEAPRKPSPSTFQNPPNTYSTIRTTSSQILASLISLLTAILDHVRISADHGDVIIDFLAPFMDEPAFPHVRTTLERYNIDAVWVMDWKRGRNSKETREPQMPELRAELIEAGIRLSLIDI